MSKEKPMNLHYALSTVIDKREIFEIDESRMNLIFFGSKRCKWK